MIISCYVIIYNHVDGFQSIDITYYLMKPKTVVSHVYYNITKQSLTLVKIQESYVIIYGRIHQQPALVIASKIQLIIAMTLAQ